MISLEIVFIICGILLIINSRTIVAFQARRWENRMHSKFNITANRLLIIVIGSVFIYGGICSILKKIIK